MKQPAGSYEVARTGETVYVRVHGLANMNNAATFQDFTHEMVEAGFRRTVLDLADCRGMDSTFMGCLVRLAQELLEAGAPAGESVVIVNADDHCRKVIDSLGLAAFVSIRDDELELPDVEMKALLEKPPPAKERLRLIRRAHEELVKIDRRNAERFGAFLAALEGEDSSVGESSVASDEGRREGLPRKPRSKKRRSSGSDGKPREKKRLPDREGGEKRLGARRRNRS